MLLGLFFFFRSPTNLKNLIFFKIIWLARYYIAGDPVLLCINTSCHPFKPFGHNWLLCDKHYFIFFILSQ